MPASATTTTPSPRWSGRLRSAETGWYGSLSTRCWTHSARIRGSTISCVASAFPPTCRARDDLRRRDGLVLLEQPAREDAPHRVRKPQPIVSGDLARPEFTADDLAVT